MKILTHKLAMWLFVSLVFAGCGSDTANDGSEPDGQGSDNIQEVIGNVPKLSSKRPNLNISILLDLSDRISPEKYPNEAMEYYQRDLGYIESISKAFTIHCLNKKMRTMDDRMQVFVEPTPSNPKINELLANLKIEITKDNASKELLEDIVPVYDDNLNEIYKSTIDDKLYPGSDIWGFFDGKASDYCIKPDYRNILFVITDGYLYYQHNQREDGHGKSNRLIPQDLVTKGLLGNDWKQVIDNKGYGFIIPQNDGLPELEVFVLGLNGYNKSPYAGDVIEYFWKTWLDGMHVKDPKLKPAELPITLDDVIAAYIYREG